MNRINSRFNSLKRDPISTTTVKLRASALKRLHEKTERAGRYQSQYEQN